MFQNIQHESKPNKARLPLPHNIAMNAHINAKATSGYDFEYVGD